ncbi:MAG TPA: polysaccharide biosynthesis/export family protein [Candidatus Hydrogenedentes bacterium]|nr:polysaccharide biosynthesis/export family protein [Candidatus Hydrogenedentota bacterium]HOL77766.1 polysaccharide biosynthesis/export family protein [Candidatus Hydrogenedentota bacterium]HPO86420.1 polysaccharide biosynthesis/export family protein [Candidatus Hydrogenedentota bacterium]
MRIFYEIVHSWHRTSCKAEHNEIVQRYASLLLCGALLATTFVTLAEEPKPLAPGEIVYIDVYRRPELSTTTQIDPNGAINLPYVGQVVIGGMSEQTASATVAERLRSVLKNPRVSVSRRLLDTGTGYRKAEMQTELIPLQNARAESLSESLQGMTSEGGAISFDADTNTLIITDTPAAICNIMAVVNRLDQMQSQLTQVRIQAKIAEVRAGAMKELGIRWFIQGEEGAGSYYPLPTQNPYISGLHGQSGDPINNETVGTANDRNVSGIGRRLVNDLSPDRRMTLPVQVPKPGQLAIGFFNGYVDVGVLLDALVADNKAELLASPNILTVNHKTAEIRSTEEFPYKEYGVDYGRTTFSTKFMDLGIILRVTPHVLNDEQGTYVKLELEPEVSYPAGSSDGVPIRSVRRSKSVANVRDGQTLVIGGIFRNDNTNMQTGVPGLRKIPIVGGLFRHTEKVKSQTELMVFVTPTVHDTPESVTWDRMLNVTSASSVMNQNPPQEKSGENRRE